jgi:circadian clock protein KaiB
MTSRRSQAAASRLVLRLYVAGTSPNSALARRNLLAVIAPLPKDQVTLEIIDVLVESERGLRDGVLVTPTLIRVAPSPEQRVVGNLRDLQALRLGLGIESAAP